MAPTPRKSKKEAPSQSPSRLTRAAALSAKRLTRSAAHLAAHSGFALTFYEHHSPTKKRSKNASHSNTVIVIEYCTQCDPFETKATELKDGLVNRVPGIILRVNPKKPREGCFEIRNEGGEKFISLLNMKPPFEALLDLDMDKVISDISDKINGLDMNPK
ncbi:uncharacterized protein LOC109807311 [Cajanus cajan]|uniref:uncharacterized protein LOC109807311 n=1 Tax=Cajanus cajan TaxID=3821 RepID=UPI00098DBE5C|nr:uncharacterized protein LOC109807311 [Cajanus cajan]